MRVSRRWTLIAGASAIAIVVALIAFDLWRSHARAIDEARRSTRNLTVAFEAHTRRSIQAVDLALSALAARQEALSLREKPHVRTMDALMQAALAGLPQVIWITLFDRTGRPLAMSETGVAGALGSVADRDYFLAWQSGEQGNAVFISEPFSGRATARWQFVMSRSLTGPDGRFAGVVAAAVDPQSFPALYSNIDIGAHGRVTLLHQNGTIVAIAPGHETFAGRSVADAALFREQLPRAESGTARQMSALEPREVLYSYSRVAGTPLVISVAFDMDDVLAGWRHDLLVYGMVAPAIVLPVLFAVFVILRNRRRAAAARLRSEAGLRALFDNTTEGMLLADAADWKFHSCNPALLRMLGHAEDELAGLRPLSIHPVEQRAVIAEQFAAMLRGELSRVPAVPVLKKDGQVFYADIEGLRVQYGGRQFIALLFRDVTATRAAQDALAMSHAAIESSINAMMFSSLKGVVSHVNSAFLKLWRLERVEQAQGLRPEAFLPEAAQIRQQALRDGGAWQGETIGLRHDGTTMDIQMSAQMVKDASGRELGRMAAFIDITERKKALRALQESEARFRSIFENANTGIASTDARGQVVSFNEAFRAMLGHDADSLGRMNFADLTHPDDLKQEIVFFNEILAGTREHYRLRKRYFAADGRLLWVDISVAATRNDRGEVVNFVAVVADIGDRMRAEEALQALNAELEQRVQERTAELEAANKDLESFSYSVAHDLKAPLRGIDGYSRLLLADHASGLDEEARNFLNNIVLATRHMNQLLEDLLVYAHLERRELHLGAVDPLALIEALLAERADEIRARGVTVRVDMGCRSVRADRDGLAMALRNLLGNALKFSREDVNPVIDIGGHDAGKTCIFSVRDNGIGFSMTYHDRIFDIFQRLERSEYYPGTGVGLAIVKKAMERMGGRVWAESEPGKGATFYLEIPE